jgi:Holliday junction resolvasome RuvABC endonuclease subunit
MTEKSTEVSLAGFDPGLANFGWAKVILTRSDILVRGMGVIRTEPENKKRKVLASDDNVRRARVIARELKGWLPEVSAICAESMSFPRNSSAAAKLGNSWGVVSALSEVYDLPVVQESPQKIKKCVTGNSSAPKDEVRDALIERFACQDFLKGFPASVHEHAWDALASIVACLDSDVVRLARQMLAA